MAVTKKLNEKNFAKLVNELHSLGEEIRTHQDEKQSVIDGFKKERKRYNIGKLSVSSVFSSSKKSNHEIDVLDKDIRGNIAKCNKTCSKIRKMIVGQSPKNIKLSSPKAPGRTKPKSKPKKRSSKKK